MRGRFRILGLGTASALSKEVGMDLDTRRFRANFYVRWDNDQPYYEDELIGRELQIGDTSHGTVGKEKRALRDDRAGPGDFHARAGGFAKVALRHQGCLGVYGAVLREGVVRINNPVYLI